jgi:hypothetical protein
MAAACVGARAGWRCFARRACGWSAGRRRLERGGPGAGGGPSGKARGEDDEREGDAEREDGQERNRRHRQACPVLQGALAQALHRLQYDGEYRCFQPEEQRRHRAELPQRGVQRAECPDTDGAGQHEQRAGGQAPRYAVHQPADIDGELLRFRPRQQGAVGQGVQEALFADPPFFVHQDAMHHRDLPRRPAEGERCDTHPRFQRLAEGDGFGHGFGFV